MMDNLVELITQWNLNRVPLFNISLPDANGEFCGVMRFCFQDDGQRVATKCVQVASTATTNDVIRTLIDKFRADIRMLSIPEYGLYEVHENGEERKLDANECPLLVQLNWNADDREGRFLMKKIDGDSSLPSSDLKASFLSRKLSKREKKEKKKKEEKEKGQVGKDTLAQTLYNELPETCFTRSISNPEAVMKRRRKQKLEQKLQQLQENGPDSGGTLRIFGECLNKEVPYKTLLLSTKDNAAFVVEQILDKYRDIYPKPTDKNSREEPSKQVESARDYCLVLIIDPTNSPTPDNNIIQYILNDDDCPLAIKQHHDPAKGQLTFHLQKRPEGHHNQPSQLTLQPHQQQQFISPQPQLKPQQNRQLPPQPPPPQLPLQPPPPQLPPPQLPPPQLPPPQLPPPQLSQPQLQLPPHQHLIPPPTPQPYVPQCQVPPPYHHSLVNINQGIYGNLPGVAMHNNKYMMSDSALQSPSPTPIRNPPMEAPVIIRLNKIGHSLGLSIVAARSLRTGRVGIFIKSIVKGGTADLDGRLQPGDQLLSVDNKSLIDVPQEVAANLITQTDTSVTLVVAKQAAYSNGLSPFLTDAPQHRVLNNATPVSQLQQTHLQQVHSQQLHPQQIHQQIHPQSHLQQIQPMRIPYPGPSLPPMPTSYHHQQQILVNNNFNQPSPPPRVMKPATSNPTINSTKTLNNTTNNSNPKSNTIKRESYTPSPSPSFTLKDMIKVLEMDEENDENNQNKNYNPNVIGAHEVYKDPREKIEAEKMKNQPIKAVIQGPEKLTFKEKMKLFAEESKQSK